MLYRCPKCSGPLADGLPRCDSCGLSVLGASLESRRDIPLPERCQYVTLGDVVPGGNIEMLVVTDRLTLYSTEAN